MKQITLINNDCLKAMRELPDNSVDSIVTDPPYGLSFMNKKWDYDVPSIEIWEECLRILKPGGHLLSFSGSRTYHRMAVRIEDAGFEIRDQIMWVYGSGFPKSHNIGKAIDKLQGNDREIVGVNGTMNNHRGNGEHMMRSSSGVDARPREENIITKGNSPYEGWGTALKPAHEPIVMARKPFKGSVAENVLKYGTGGINIDESRIGTDGGTYNSREALPSKSGIYGDGLKGGKVLTLDNGRFPANIIFDEEAGKILDEQSGQLKTGGVKRQVNNGANQPINLGGGLTKPREASEGGASRFFYCPKANKKDRNEGLEVNSSHPTVKPTKLMEYLIKLVTPKNGIVLDPFMGSGSTGKAAIKNNFAFIGIEREKEYFEIAKNRIQHQNTLNYPIEINQD